MTVVGKSGCTRATTGEIIQNLIVGLTVSFVALSLGAALGLLSGRGAYAGMISAGIIALVTSLFGGTRVQCSGPTAPMSAVSAVLIAFAFEKAELGGMGVSPNHFINLVFIMTGVMLILFGIFRFGKYIALVPKVVVSGFMSGIALQIWFDQVSVLTGFNGKKILEGDMITNLSVALGTVALVFGLGSFMKKFMGAAARFLPATLLAILIMTALSMTLGLSIEKTNLQEGITGLASFGSFVKSQIPSNITWGLIVMALPFAFQLALLCYLDTLLTSLVVDRMSGERTLQNKELVAQGAANGLVAFVGGIPGAQATIRSVLMLKENATLRLSGIAVGVFVIVELIMFRDFLNLIPKAVFVGVLIKVGYDVFDFTPLRLYMKEFFAYRGKGLRDLFTQQDDEEIIVTNREIFIILGTMLVTVVMNLNIAVFSFTVIFYLHNKVFMKHNPMGDLAPVEEGSEINRED